MATLDDYCEARSSDESDAGSLEDFIVGSESDDGSEETVPSSDNDQEVDAANIIATRQAGTLRRSTRTSKAPVRYVDDDYIRLMTEDADAEVAVSGDDERHDSSDNVDEDEEYDEEFSESETSYDSSSEDEKEQSTKKRRIDPE